jgi:hypothetical protein
MLALARARAPRTLVSVVGAVLLVGALGCGQVPGMPPQPVVPAGPQGGIAGYVRDEQGRPIGGATVAASCQVREMLIVSSADGWYDLGSAGLAPGPCSIKGGSPDGVRSFFGDVVVVSGTSQRVDFVARRG